MVWTELSRAGAGTVRSPIIRSHAARPTEHDSKWLTRKRRIDPALHALGWRLDASAGCRRTEEEETDHGPADHALAKAFRGELVPIEAELARQKGRDYEPASALLERIRAERMLPRARPNGQRAVDGRSRQIARRQENS